MRAFGIEENPSDVLKKIDDFISNKDNTVAIMDNIGDMMGLLDKTEMVVNNLEERAYREEILGYITNARNYIMSMLDAMDSMLGE
jgi:hypothetical protein